MAGTTFIGWTDATLNPLAWRCNHVTDECDLCYAETLTNRYHGADAFTSEPPYLKPGRLLLPWTDPKMRVANRIFLESMSDPFHPGVPVEDQALIWGMMAADPRHEYQVLSKRPHVGFKLLTRPDFPKMVVDGIAELLRRFTPKRRVSPQRRVIMDGIEAAAAAFTWPLRNVIVGVSAGQQSSADKFIPPLLQIPAALRFVSVEPQIGPVDLTRIAAGREQQPGMVYDVLGQRYGVPGQWQAPMSTGLDWVIIGGESGRVFAADPMNPPLGDDGKPVYARPMRLGWARDVKVLSEAAGVPVYMKQLGSAQAALRDLDFKGEDWDRWSAELDDLKVREHNSPLWVVPDAA
jgi:protein gp37